MGAPLAGSSPRQRGRAHTTADLTMQQQGATLPAGAKQLQLVGGIPIPLKNMKINWYDYSQYMEK